MVAEGVDDLQMLRVDQMADVSVWSPDLASLRPLDFTNVGLTAESDLHVSVVDVEVGQVGSRVEPFEEIRRDPFEALRALTECQNNKYKRLAFAAVVGAGSLSSAGHRDAAIVAGYGNPVPSVGAAR